MFIISWLWAICLGSQHTLSKHTSRPSAYMLSGSQTTTIHTGSQPPLPSTSSNPPKSTSSGQPSPPSAYIPTAPKISFQTTPLSTDMVSAHRCDQDKIRSKLNQNHPCIIFLNWNGMRSNWPTNVLWHAAKINTSFLCPWIADMTKAKKKEFQLKLWQLT